MTSFQHTSGTSLAGSMKTGPAAYENHLKQILIASLYKTTVEQNVPVSTLSKTAGDTPRYLKSVFYYTGKAGVPGIDQTYMSDTSCKHKNCGYRERHIMNPFKTMTSFAYTYKRDVSC